MIWLLVAPLAAWTAVRLLGVEHFFPLVVLVAFTPYAVLAAFMAMLIAAALRSWPAAALAGASVVALLLVVAPRAVRSEPPVQGSARTLRLMTINVRLGRASAPALVAMVRRERVDVLSVQELTPAMAAALHAAELSAQLPHSVLRPWPGAAGTGLYARTPLQREAAPAGTTFAMVAARTGGMGAPMVAFVAVHAPAPVGSTDVSRWRHDLRALPSARPRGPIRVLAGDFNATLDHRELRNLLDKGYQDAAAEVGMGLEPTWPSHRLLPPPVTIDHVLVEGRLRVGRVSVLRVPGSDHRAVLAELMLPRAAA